MTTKRKYKRKRALHGASISHKAITGKVKHTAISTGKDLLIGVIGGGIAGAVIGKPALLIGVGVTGYGHYANKPSLTTFGIGMMASGGFSGTPITTSTTQGIDGFSVDDVKARVMNFKDSIISRLFLDKIIKKTESTGTSNQTDNGSNGVGEVQYLPSMNPNKELDFSALDNLEKQITKSGADYQKSIQGMDQETVQGNSDESLEFTDTSY
jgi:hypothetical protein